MSTALPLVASNSQSEVHMDTSNNPQIRRGSNELDNKVSKLISDNDFFRESFNDPRISAKKRCEIMMNDIKSRGSTPEQIIQNSIAALKLASRVKDDRMKYIIFTDIFKDFWIKGLCKHLPKEVSKKFSNSYKSITKDADDHCKVVALNNLIKELISELKQHQS